MSRALIQRIVKVTVIQQICGVKSVPKLNVLQKYLNYFTKKCTIFLGKDSQTLFLGLFDVQKEYLLKVVLE